MVGGDGGQRVAFEDEGEAIRLAQIWNDMHVGDYDVEVVEDATQEEILAGKAVFALEDMDGQ